MLEFSGLSVCCGVHVVIDSPDRALRVMGGSVLGVVRYSDCFVYTYSHRQRASSSSRLLKWNVLVRAIVPTTADIRRS